MAAAALIQAARRGWASRQRTAALLQRHRQRRALLAELHAAVDAGEVKGAQQAAAQLEALGFGAEAARLVSGLERQAAEAAQALSTAAARGGAAEYQAAAAAAGQYSHLVAAIQRAAALFAGRVAAAEEAVNRALQGGQAGVGQLDATPCGCQHPVIDVRLPASCWLAGLLQLAP